MNPFRAVRNRLQNIGFVKNVAVLAGGTAFAQALSILLSPVLTRLYSPHDYGMMAVYTSIVTILLAFVSLRYEAAIPLPEDSEERVNLMALCMLLISSFFVVTLIMVGFLGKPFAVWLHMGRFHIYFWLIPISVLGGGIYQALTYWSTWQEKFGLISRTRVSQSIGQSLIQLVLGFVIKSPLGLMLGDVGNRMLGWTTLWRAASIPWKTVSWSGMRSVARKYIEFPLFTLSGTVVNLLGVQLLPILFARFFTTEIVGYYSLANRIMGIPSGLVGQAIAQVVYPMASKSRNAQKDMKAFNETLVSTLFTTSLYVFGFVAVVGPQLFSIVFGAKWYMAGYDSRLLAPWFIVSFVSSPLSTYSLVYGKQKQAFWITLYETIFRLVAIYCGYLLSSPRLALTFYSIAGFIIASVYILWILHVIQVSVLQVFIRSKWVFIGLVGVIVVFLVAEQWVPASLYMIVSILVFACLAWPIGKNMRGLIRGSKAVN